MTSHTDVRNVVPRSVLLILSPLSAELEARSASLALAIEPTAPTPSPPATVESVFPPGVNHGFTQKNAARETLTPYHVSQSVTNIPE